MSYPSFSQYPKDETMWRFIHIPKNAGTAVREALGGSGAYPNTHPHTPACAFASMALQTFAVIRNPFDRMVSICAHVHRGLDAPLKVNTFRDWVCSGCPLQIIRGTSTIVSQGYVTDTLRLQLTEPQATYIRNDTLFIPYDNVQAGLEEVIRALKISPKTLKIPVVNSSQRERPVWQEYYNDEVRSIVRAKFNADFLVWHNQIEWEVWK